MIFHFCCFIHLYPDLTRCVQACVIQFQVPDWMKVWIKIDAIPYPIISRLCPSALHKRSSFQLAPFKQQADLLSSSSHFLKKNQLFYPVTLFIYLILFRSIILKVISTYIYPLKSHILDLALKRFHKHSRSSFREIVLFAWNFKED